MEREIIRLLSVDSTNEYLKRNFETLRDNCAVIAETQTGGKGTNGRSFFSGKGGAYVSILLKPPFKFPIDMITPLSAVAVKRTLDKFGCENTQIKWVNDVLISGKKVCGILCESIYFGGYKCVIVGTGINVYPPRTGYPDDIKERIASVYTEEKENAVEDTALAFIKEFFALYDTVSEQEIAKRYVESSSLIGENIEIIRGDQTLRGKCVGFNEKCNLLLDTGNEIITVCSGSVKY